LPFALAKELNTIHSNNYLVSKKLLPRSDDPWIDETVPIESHLSQLNNPVYIITFLSIIFYMFISIYYSNFFAHLSLPFNTLNLPLTFYLASGNSIVKNFGTIFVILTIVSLTSRKKRNENANVGSNYYSQDKSTLGQILPLMFFKCLMFLLVLSLCIQALPFSYLEKNFMPYVIIPYGFTQLLIGFDSENPRNIGWIITFLIILIFYCLWFLCKIYNYMCPVRSKCVANAVYTTYNKNFSGLIKILSFAAIIANFFYNLIYFIPATIGFYAAEDLIRGKVDHLEIDITLKDINSTNLLNKTLILITQCNSNYYLIEKCDPIPNNTSQLLYIIPENQMQIAALTKMHVEQPASGEFFTPNNWGI